VFLYIDPLKQGLKPNEEREYYEAMYAFLYIDPLKQGLKHISSVSKEIPVSSGFYT